MKTIILLLLMAMSIQSFPQARFSKRKYTKGMFTEKRHRIKKGTQANNPHPAKTGISVVTDDVPYFDTSVVISTEGDSGIFENTVTNKTIISGKDYPANSENQAMEDVRHTIPKHNTMKAAAEEDVYGSRSGNLMIKAGHQMIQQESKATSAVMQMRMSYGKSWSDFFDSLKRLVLIILIIILALLLVTAILAIIFSPVASLSWGLGITLAVYSILGIVICSAHMCDRNGGKFMEYLTAIFAVASLILLYSEGAVSKRMNAYE